MTTRDSLIASALALTLLAGGAHAFEPAGQDIVYDVDGETFEGYLASAEGEARAWSAFLILLDEAL
jgi:hypothetical protein